MCYNPHKYPASVEEQLSLLMTRLKSLASNDSVIHLDFVFWFSRMTLLDLKSIACQYVLDIRYDGKQFGKLVFKDLPDMPHIELLYLFDIKNRNKMYPFKTVIIHTDLNSFIFSQNDGHDHFFPAEFY